MSGNIKILEKIGSGGMGEIYKAHLIGPGGFEKLVAVKKIAPWNANSDFQTLLATEAKNLALLHHQNIAEIYDLKELDGSLAIVMEFVEGETLKDLSYEANITKTQISAESIYEVFRQILEVLKYAHESRPEKKPTVLHRDISPHNIMVNENGLIKLLDFGVAKIIHNLDEITHTSNFSGKFKYAAPESLASNIYSEQSDLYSIGVVIYELATGHSLFNQNSLSSSLSERRDFEIPDLSLIRRDLDEEFSKIIMRLLKVNPEDRPSSAKEILGELIDFNGFKISGAETLSNEVRQIKAKIRGNSETATAIKNVSLKSKTKTLRKYSIGTASAIALVALIGVLYSSKIRTPNLPKIIVQVKSEKFDISPEEISYTDISEINPGEFNKDYSCEMICHDIFYSIALPWGDFIYTNPPKETSPQMLISNISNSITRLEKVHHNIFNKCPLSMGCSKAKDLYPTLQKSISNLKNKVQESTSYSQLQTLTQTEYALDANNFSKINFFKNPNTVIAQTESFRELMSRADFFEVSPLTKLDLIKIPADSFPKNSNECKILMELYWWARIYQNKVSPDYVYRTIALPSDTKVDIIGFTENELRLSLPEKEDSIFTNGICYYDNTNSSNILSRYWIPHIGTQMGNN